MKSCNGILMSYDVLDMKSCWQDTPPVPGFIQINYCNEGCFEFELETGEIGFLSSGDLAISDTNGSQICIFTYSLRKIQRHFYYD